MNKHKESTAKSYADVGLKIVGIVSLFVGLIWGVIQIYDYYAEDEIEISAHGTIHEFNLPDSRELIISQIKESWKIDTVTYSVIKGKMNEHALYIKKFAKVKQFIQIEITNVGDIEISDMRIETPQEGYFRFISQGASSLAENFEHTIDIGTLRSGGQVEIEIWSTTRMLGFDTDEISVTSPTGATKISFSRNVDGYLAWLDEKGDNIFLSVFLLSLVVGFFIFAKMLIEVEILKEARKKQDIDEVP